MYSAYGEFLSLAHIDSAVDGIYKAYLDSVLIGIRIEAKTDPAYWSAVEGFRKDNLDPFTRAAGQTMLKDEDLAARKDVLGRDEAKRERFEQANDYLYWFDLRAKFWDKTAIDDQIRALVTSPDDLLRLEQAAKELQRRRERALQASSSGLPLLDSMVVYLGKLYARAKKASKPPRAIGSGVSEAEADVPEPTG